MTDLQGTILAGSNLRPSSDLPTHLALYQAFPGVHGVVHTHSRYATSWAQAGVEIPCLGTTHADYFQGPIPITRAMTPHEIQSEYEWNTGQVIIKRFHGLDPLQTTAVLVNGHAPFCWGASVTDAAHTAEIVEELAHMAFLTVTLKADVAGLPDVLRDKHFLRKHGPAAYYGQNTPVKA
jgi:L-ribulose-5-phosphate 4-epimerase